MTKKELQERTKRLALSAMIIIRELPRSHEGKVLGVQLLRSATSVAANYRSACRARSGREFVYKLGVAEEEADETQFWLELIQESGLLDSDAIRKAWKESGEILAILAASRLTAKRNLTSQARLDSLNRRS